VHQAAAAVVVGQLEKNLRNRTMAIIVQIQNDSHSDGTGVHPPSKIDDNDGMMCEHSQAK
jgi:hypothetical protein